MTKIVGKLESVWPDRTQYKPYAYNLRFDDVYVELDVPEESVTETTITVMSEKGEETEKKIKCLDLDGFTCILGSLADAIDELHSNKPSDNPQLTKKLKITDEDKKLFNE